MSNSDTVQLEKTTNDLQQVFRHGYAVYAGGDVFIGWVPSIYAARQLEIADYVVNVQNGAKALI